MAQIKVYKLIYWTSGPLNHGEKLFHLQRIFGWVLLDECVVLSNCVSKVSIIATLYLFEACYFSFHLEMIHFLLLEEALFEYYKPGYT